MDLEPCTPTNPNHHLQPPSDSDFSLKEGANWGPDCLGD